MTRRLCALTAALFATLGCDTMAIDAITVPAGGAASGPTVSPNPLPPTLGPMRTSGSQILDANDDPVHLAGISWFGFETGNYALHGLWERSLESFLDQIAGLGFNLVRVPFSNQLFDPSSTPNSIDFTQNPELEGLSGLQILDHLIDAARDRDLRVVLERHHPSANSESALWYDERYDEARWISDWVMLAERYRDEPTVIGFELHDGPADPATWGDDSSSDWRAAAQRAGNAILSSNPNLLIFVAGVETVDSSVGFGGENLSAAGANPVQLMLEDRVVYSVHDFSASVSRLPWFDAADYPDNLPAVWDSLWGYLARDDLAPVVVSAFGTRLEQPEDEQWLEQMVGYLQQRDLGFAFWCLNPNSGDTGGLLLDDWQTLDARKLELLSPLLMTTR